MPAHTQTCTPTTYQTRLRPHAHGTHTHTGTVAHQTSKPGRVRPSTGDDDDDEAVHNAAASAPGPAEPSVREMSEHIRKIRADIAETTNLTRVNEQNLAILRRKVTEARAAKAADEEKLRARLSEIRAELDSVKNKTVPEWVSTVDVATGLVYFMNTKTKHSQWRPPPDFDGTFVLCDDDTGFIASTRLQPSVADGTDPPPKASLGSGKATASPDPGRNAEAQRRLSIASVAADGAAANST